MKPLDVAARFDMPGELVTVKSIGRGNVNDTYQAVFRDGPAESRMVLQRINRSVFPKPEWIMANMRLVTDFLDRKLRESSGRADRQWRFPRVIAGRDGQDFFIDEEGGFWRSITMIESAISCEKVTDPAHAAEVGAVLGCFHRLIATIDPASLYDTLPGFHICPGYLAKYDAVVAGEGNPGRLAEQGETARLRRFVEARRGLAGVLEQARAEGVLLLRPIHGDPKVDNVMIDEYTGVGVGIVDLDTVKPGLIHYDFGDALRSACNLAGEDAARLDDVVFDLPTCRAFVGGYLAQAADILTESDRGFLFDSVRLLAFELGLRFFSDYLAGDRYFKVRYDDQNLHRARVQFRLCERIEGREAEIRRVLNMS